MTPSYPCRRRVRPGPLLAVIGLTSKPWQRASYRARSFHADGTVDHIAYYILDLCFLYRIPSVVQDTSMEIAVAYMSEDTSEDTKRT